MCLICKNQPRGGVGDDAGGEVRGASGVERDGEDAAKQASEESGNPGCRVFAPENDALAGKDGAAVELGSEAPGEIRDLGVRRRMAAYSAVAHNSGLRPMTAEVFDEAGKVESDWNLLQLR